jgi:hypothetical protein
VTTRAVVALLVCVTMLWASFMTCSIGISPRVRRQEVGSESLKFGPGKGGRMRLNLGRFRALKSNVARFLNQFKIAPQPGRLPSDRLASTMPAALLALSAPKRQVRIETRKTLKTAAAGLSTPKR